MQSARRRLFGLTPIRTPRRRAAPTPGGVGGKRFGLVDALTTSVVSLSRKALAAARPEAAKGQILLESVGLHYDREHESELREFFRERAD